MKIMARLPFALLIVFSAACSSGGSSNSSSADGGDAGTTPHGGDAGTLPPDVLSRAFVEATMGPGQNAVSACQLVPATWLAIGTSTASVNDGATQDGAKVSVACEVVPEGSAFRVTASASLNGAGEKSGAVTVSGLVTGRGVDRNIEGTFQRGDIGTFTQKDCTLEFGGPVMGVAGGLVWGTLRCPTAVFAAQGRTCEGTAEVKFENCEQ